MKVVAVVGLAGAGKSEVARVFEKGGFFRIRFGDITDAELESRGLKTNEENERSVRESLRQEHGMAAYAVLSLPEIHAALARSNVVVDGLYSWEEYKVMKEHYRDGLLMVSVLASPKTRYERLGRRKLRPLAPEDARSRDFAEIENIHKAGPIVMADYMIVNESSLDDLRREAEKVANAIKCLRD
ncbi:MAG: AAA family ATPase [Chloroflexi bacterium]|nr:AAA family ATPase [Chloroflexota bacterium]